MGSPIALEEDIQLLTLQCLFSHMVQSVLRSITWAFGTTECNSILAASMLVLSIFDELCTKHINLAFRPACICVQWPKTVHLEAIVIWQSCLISRLASPTKPATAADRDLTALVLLSLYHVGCVL